jgi:hypothetical protein
MGGGRLGGHISEAQFPAQVGQASWLPVSVPGDLIDAVICAAGVPGSFEFAGGWPRASLISHF